jgi:protein O-GlcNAc transferase
MTPAQLQQTVQLIQAGRPGDAAKICSDVLRANPKQFEALYLLGFAHMRMKKFEDAARIIGEAIEINPSQADAYYNRGCALQELGRDGEALAAYERALIVNPNYLEAEFNRATSLVRLRRLAEAEQAFGQLARKTPQDAEVWHNLGEVCFGMGRHLDAASHFEHALVLSPRSVRTLDKHATTAIALRDFETAAVDYEKILAIDPQYEYAQGGLLYARLNCCDWRDLERQKKTLEKAVRAGKRAVSPLTCVLFSESPADQKKCAETWYGKTITAKPSPIWTGERYGHGKIRLAYVSGDFRNHAVARLMAGIIEAHDRERFEVIGVSLGADDDSAMRTRLKAAFDRFEDVNTRSDAQAALWMRENEVDIAVDLMIYTGSCRPGIFAHRGVPVQAGYLGYAGTGGGPHLDYILADAIVIPEADKKYYSEKVVTLPNCFQPNDAQRRAADNDPTRAKEGLPEDGFVFCSFNNSCKIQPAVFDIWMRLLHAVQGSVLWLPKYNATEANNLTREAGARGIGPGRIVFAELVPTPEEYLSRLVLADLFLDTLPYNAHTTASDALWMGVPVLTRLGVAYAGRVAASALMALDLPEMVTHSAEEYEAKALELARNPAALKAIRTKLAAIKITSPLFDTVRQCRNLEAAYLRMHRMAEAGEAPADFAVSE